MTNETNRQQLFNYFSKEHGINLLDSEMNDIYSICIGHEEYVKMLNFVLRPQNAKLREEMKKESNFNGHFFVLIAIIFVLSLTGMYLKSSEPQPSIPTINFVDTDLKITDTINLHRATTYWCDTSQCDSNPYSTADGSIINPANPGRWVALSRDLLTRWGGEFDYGDTIDIYSKNNPNLNGWYVVHDCMNAKYTMSIDFLMSPKENIPKLGIGKDVKIIMCHEGI